MTITRRVAISGAIVGSGGALGGDQWSGWGNCWGNCWRVSGGQAESVPASPAVNVTARIGEVVSIGITRRLDHLLRLEGGDYLLLEDGGRLRLQGDARSYSQDYTRRVGSV